MLQSLKLRTKVCKEIFVSWSEACDINCYTKLLSYKNNYFIQFVWLFILITSTCATFFVISKSVLDYLGHDVVSLTEVVYERPIRFPTVTFCDNNQFSTRHSQSLIKNISIEFNLPVKFENTFKLASLARLHAAALSYGDENRKKLGFNYNQIGYCLYDETDCKNDLHWYYSYDYGNCFQYNSGFNYTNHRISKLKLSRVGIDFGPKIVVFPFLNSNEYLTNPSNGLVLFVHEPRLKASYLLFSIF